MNEVTIKTETLIERLRENRNNHRQIFEEALEGYRREAIAELERSLEDARTGKKIQRSLTLVEPQDHTSDYDAALDMLELSVDENVTIDAHTFRCYVRDEWGWRDQFIQSNARYSETAASFAASL